MKAAVFREVGHPMLIEDVTIDNPGPREVLVRVSAVGLCHSDLHVLDGGLPNPSPSILGHEGAGIVEKVGSEVHTVKPGDHVIVSLVFYCGHCEHCNGGHVARCFTPEAERGPKEPPRLRIGTQAVHQFCRTGSFAEQMLVHESGCIPIRRDMPLDRACLIACGVSTGFGAAVNTAGVRPGQTVAVIGCGGVGLSAVNGAREAGAGHIIAIDVVPSKREFAMTFGATDFVSGSTEEALQKTMELTGGKGVDHALECIGRQDTIELSFKLLKKGGTATIVGVPKLGTTLNISAFSFLQERKLQGSIMGSVRTAIDLPNLVDLYMQGRLKLDELISKRRPLSEINEGFEDMKTGALARTVVMFDA